MKIEIEFEPENVFERKEIKNRIKSYFRQNISRKYKLKNLEIKIK